MQKTELDEPAAVRLTAGQLLQLLDGELDLDSMPPEANMPVGKLKDVQAQLMREFDPGLGHAIALHSDRRGELSVVVLDQASLQVVKREQLPDFRRRLQFFQSREASIKGRSVDC